MSRLKAILAANAVSCVGFGVLFLTAPGDVAAFLGHPPAPTLLMTLLGAGLVLNGIHLIYVATGSRQSRMAVTYFSTGDFLWVGGTLALVLSGIWINSPAGMAAALVVACAVGAFGLIQWRLRPPTERVLSDNGKRGTA
jgi:hypothetical protein